jgi:hypothetical protein
MRLGVDGNLLIGTSTTAKRLTVFDTAESVVSLQRGTNTANNKVLIDFIMQNSSTTLVTYAQIGAAIQSSLSGSVTSSLVIHTTNASVTAEKARFDNQGNLQMQAGAVMAYAPTPASISAATTITSTNLQAQIINTTGTTYTITMPNTTTLANFVSWATDNMGYDFFVINTASGTITLAGTTNVTTLGTMTITTGTSAQFRIRRVSSGSYIVYRL